MWNLKLLGFYISGNARHIQVQLSNFTSAFYIAGEGAFVLRDIAQSSFLVEYGGKLLTAKEGKHRVYRYFTKKWWYEEIILL